MATQEQAVVTIDRLVRELDKRRSDVDTLSEAYAGEFKLHFASEDFREFFADRYQSFSDNWCGIVADAPHERLKPIGIRLPGEVRGDTELWSDWTRTQSDAFCDLAMLDAIIAKRAYALVWGDEDDQPQITWEHPSQAIVEYDPETRARTAGAKVWCDDAYEYATLYLSDEIWKFQRSRVTSNLELPSYLTSGGWSPRGNGVMPNPMGKVPLVEMANRPRLVGEPMSDIAGAMAMQHAVNLFWAQLFAASDEATIGQRVVIGAEKPKLPKFNAAGDVVGYIDVDLRKFARGSAIWLENPAAKVEQWSPAKLDVFTDVVEIAVGHIAAQTRTPAHYLLIGGTIANVSGDAMKALETGLVKRTEEKTEHFGRAIRDVFELVALARGENAKAAQVRQGKVLWQDVENRSDAQRTDALLKKRDVGYPLRYLLELDGLPPDEIERVMTMVREEQTDPVLSRILNKTTQVSEFGGDAADLGD